MDEQPEVIESLSEEQWAEARRYRDHVIAMYQSSEPFSWEKKQETEECIRWLYEQTESQSPDVLWVGGPRALIQKLVWIRRFGMTGVAEPEAFVPVSEATNEEWEWAGSCLVYEHWWLGVFYYYLFVNTIVPKPVSDELRRNCEQWIGAHVSLSAFLPELAIVSENHTHLALNAEGQLHDETGPAWAWADGTALYSLEGVRVPGWVVCDPPSPQRILTELANAEQRRVAFNHMGWASAVDGLGLEPIDTHQNPHMGTLYRLPEALLGNSSSLLVARNGSPHPNGEYQLYGLLCSPEANTVIEAQASLARVSVEEMRELEGRT